MSGSVLYLCGSQNDAAECLAGAAHDVGIVFTTVEMGALASDALPRLDEIRSYAWGRIPRGEIAGLLAGDRVSAICAAYMAERQGLLFHPVEAMETCAQRLMTRECLRAAGLQVAAGFLVPSIGNCEDAIHRTSFPCVLKPLRFTGSQGVFRADSPDQFHDVYRRLRGMTGETAGEYFLVEEYVGGEEITFHGFAVSSRMYPLALIDRQSSSGDPAFEDRILTMPSRQPRQVAAELIHVSRLAAQAMGLNNGPVSVELRRDGQRTVVMDVNPFPPPLPVCRALSQRGSKSFGRMILMASAGLAEPEFEPPRASGVGYLPLPEPGIFAGLEGVEEALSVECVDEVVASVHVGEFASPPPDGNHRAAFVIARGESVDEVEASLIEALSRLKALIKPAQLASTQR